MGVWLVVMAICLAVALAIWIGLVFRSERHEPEQMHESSPHREVNGGRFDAHAGGRQVMPDPHAPLEPEQPGSRPQAGMPERAPARGDRP